MFSTFLKGIRENVWDCILLLTWEQSPGPTGAIFYDMAAEDGTRKMYAPRYVIRRVLDEYASSLGFFGAFPSCISALF